MLSLSRLRKSRIHRIAFYAKGISRSLIPRFLLSSRIPALERKLGEERIEDLRTRLDYYFPVREPFPVPPSAERIGDITLAGNSSTYFYDLMEFARYFPSSGKLLYRFGDSTAVPDFPTLVKARPVSEFRNSILFKLGKVRHFHFEKDRLPFRSKRDSIIWRGAVYQSHRVAFMEKFWGKSPRIDVAQSNKKGKGNPEWYGEFTTVPQQLDHKFVLSIEGNDVATNTKWIMGSNSLLFMRKPTCETWFMEGTLIPGTHYVQVADDYADMEEKMDYYLAHPDEAEAITRNANEYVSQFLDHVAEDWLSFKVIERYLELSTE